MIYSICTLQEPPEPRSPMTMYSLLLIVIIFDIGANDWIVDLEPLSTLTAGVRGAGGAVGFANTGSGDDFCDIGFLSSAICSSCVLVSLDLSVKREKL